MAYRMGRTIRKESDGVLAEIQIYEIQERLLKHLASAHCTFLYPLCMQSLDGFVFPPRLAFICVKS